MCKLSIVILQSLILSTLIGCSEGNIFRDRSQDYKIAKECPSLRIPANVKAECFSDDYEIPTPAGQPQPLDKANIGHNTVK
jgi:uncharacterized lipoprotein